MNNPTPNNCTTGTAGPADFGPAHTPGLLLRPPGLLDASLPNLPPASGLGCPLPPARMHERSCVPPPFSEPLLPVGPGARAEAVQRDAVRIVQPESLMGRLVYDSLVPPERPPSTANAAATAAMAAGSSISAGGSGSNGVSAGSTSTSSLAYAPDLEPWYLPESHDDTTLVFESRFECGNLRRAVQVQQYEYDLVLQPDINTKGHTQWFYFAVSNTRAGQAYRFNIVNLLKNDSLYNHGMLPLVHSERRLQAEVRCDCTLVGGRL